MKKWVWMVPAMAGLVMAAGCNTTRKPTPVTPAPQPVAPVGSAEAVGSWDVNEFKGIEQRTFVPAKNLPTPSVAQTTPYVIAQGDSLSKIAAQYDLRWQDIAAVNPGINPNKLRVNQTIQLPGVVDVTKKRELVSKPVVVAPVVTKPAPTPVADNVYIVKRGDTLSQIAHAHGVKTAELKAANGLTSDLIKEKQKLVLPAGAKKDGTPVKQPVPPKLLPEKAVVETPPPVNVVVAPDNTLPTLVLTEDDTAVEYRTHTVQAGDDIFKLSKEWGVTPVDLRELNNINVNVLVPGTVLRIPPPAIPQK